MKIIGILIYILIAAFAIMFLYGAALFIINFFGMMFDIIIGTNTYWMWSFS